MKAGLWAKVFRGALLFFLLVSRRTDKFCPLTLQAVMLKSGLPRWL